MSSLADASPGCIYPGGPPLNLDVSGIGVRISFYLQTLFLGEYCSLYAPSQRALTSSILACLSARSGSLDEITGTLYTLIATNMAMAVTSLLLGLKPQPEISFQE